MRASVPTVATSGAAALGVATSSPCTIRHTPNGRLFIMQAFVIST
jgi:hypothetical protein